MKLGSDEVRIDGERVIIHAANAMDWPVREFCRPPIWFQGRKYYLLSRRDGLPPRPVIYELCPWPEDLFDESNRSVVYDEEYVRDRDKSAGCSRRGDRLHLLLLPLYPALGLFWSGFKSRVLGPLGFEPGSITRASIALIFNLFLLEGIFVGWLAGGILTYFLERPTLRPVDWALLLLLGVDSAVRFGQSLQMDVERHWGFCEWLWPGNRR